MNLSTQVRTLAAKMVGNIVWSNEPINRLCSSSTWRVGVIGFILLKAWMSTDTIFAEDYTFMTLAGPAETRRGWIDVVDSVAQFNRPAGLASDSIGNMYVADTGNHVIYRISPAGEVKTVAGLHGSSGHSDGKSGAARFFAPAAVAVDESANVYVADTGNHTIRKVTPAGEVSTLAGRADSRGEANGTGSAALFRGPRGIAVDCVGNVYVADTNNETIRKVTPQGKVTTLAGKERSSGNMDGSGSEARFHYPFGIAVDRTGNVYVTEYASHRIRKIDPDGIVTTLAGRGGTSGTKNGVGSAAWFVGPAGVAVDDIGNLYITELPNHTIRKVSPAGLVTMLAGQPLHWGRADGPGNMARFNGPIAIAVDNAGNLYVSDAQNFTIRKGCLLESKSADH